MDDSNDILDFLLKRKSDCILVAQPDVDTICRYACALGNQSGGSIIVGMDENSNIIGVKQDDVSVISHQLLQEVRPNVPFTLYTVIRDGKIVIVVSVLEGANKPYGISGRFYIMDGDACKEVDSKQMNRLFDSKEAQETNWEREPVSDATLDDLNDNVIERIKGYLVQDNIITKDSDAHGVLKALGFKKEGQATNAAIVITGKQPSMFFPQTRVRVSVFGENNELEDVRLFDCSLIDAVDQIVEYVYNLYPDKLIIDNMERRMGERIPKVALREGVLNACVHRIYDNYRSFVRVNVYPDKLEILNSGNFMQGVTIEDLGRKHNSMLRNPDIANAFFVIKYIEAAGSGTLRIIDECLKNNCEAPVWEECDGCVKLTFRVERPVIKKKATRDKLVENLSSDGATRTSLLQILDYLSEHDNVKNNDISVLINKSYATVKRYMQILKDAGLIEYQGSLKTGGWMITK